MKVGYVGLGAMGNALASRLVVDHELWVWDLNVVAMQTLVEQGATAAASLADMGSHCKVVVLCLPKSANVRDALFGEGGLAQSLSPGALVIDQTSGLPEDTTAFAAELEKRGINFIDAPVAGGVPAAQAGLITIMASGSDAAFERAYPVLASISPKVFRCSAKVGDGQTLKAINNMANAACRMTTLEVLAVGRALGLTAAAMTDSLNNGEGRSFITARLLPAVVEGRSSTDFSLGLMVKDLNQAARLGVTNRFPMPISDTARGMIHSAFNLLGGQSRLDDIVPFMESLTAMKFVSAGEEDAGHASRPLPAGDAMRLIKEAVVACNRFIILENAALAVTAGLTVERFAPVLESGSASSAEAERLFAGMLGRGGDVERTVGTMLDSLTKLTNFGSDSGIPMLMTNQVRAQCLASAVDLGLDGSLFDLTRRYLRRPA